MNFHNLILSIYKYYFIHAYIYKHKFYAFKSSFIHELNYECIINI